jgi:hypothetical protein
MPNYVGTSKSFTMDNDNEGGGNLLPTVRFFEIVTGVSQGPAVPDDERGDGWIAPPSYAYEGAVEPSAPLPSGWVAFLDDDFTE